MSSIMWMFPALPYTLIAIGFTVVGYRQFQLVRLYWSLPTLQEYRDELCDAGETESIHCIECGGTSIWRLGMSGLPRMIFECRRCGEPLYRR